MVLAIFLGTVIAFSNSDVQTWAASKATESLNKDFDTDIKIDKIQFTYFGDVVIKGGLAMDHRQDTVIYFNRLETSLLGFSKLISGNPELGDTKVDKLYLNIKRYKGEDLDNLAQFIESFDTGKERKKPSTPFVLTASDLEVTDSRLNVIDEELRIPEAFVASKMNLTATDFKIEGSDILANIQDGNFHFYNGGMLRNDTGEVNGLDVRRISADFSYTPSQIKAADLIFETRGSYLIGDLELNYKREDFAEFITKVEWDFDIERSDLATNELRQFYDEIVPNESVQVSGRMLGTLNDFSVENLAAYSLNDIAIEGDMHFMNLLENEDDFFIEGTFEDLRLSNRDLKTFLPNILGKNLPSSLNDLGNVRARGYASVNANRFVSGLSGTSRLGRFKTDLVLDDIQRKDIAYSGLVEFNRFNLGRILGIPDLGEVTLNLAVKGRGFDPSNAQSRIKGTIPSVRFRDYTYRNIKVDGNLKEPLFDGKLNINDPNFKLDFSGLADFSENTNEYIFTADLIYADLKATGLFDRDSLSILKGKIDINMRGTNINDAYGYIQINHASYTNQEREFSFEDFGIVSGYDADGTRQLTIDSPDLIQGELSGNFRIEEIPVLFQNSIGKAYSNFKYSELSADQNMDFDLIIDDTFIDILLPKVELASNSKIKGRVASDARKFNLRLSSPAINAYGVQMDSINLQIDNDNPVFNTYLTINRVGTPVLNAKDFRLINITRNDTLLFRTEFKNEKREGDMFNFGFYHTLDNENRSIVGIRKSDIRFQGKRWFINRLNQKRELVFNHNFNQISLDTIVARHKTERIELAGIIQDDQTKNLHLDFRKVRIASLLEPIDSLKLRGEINGNLDINQVNGNYAPSSNFNIKDFVVNNTPLGDFDLKVEGNEDLSIYDVRANLVSTSSETFTAQGEISTTGDFSTIDLNADFRDFDLVALSPLGGVVLDNMRGLATGGVKLSGKLVEPEIDGKLYLKKTGLRLPYLNTDFDFEENTAVDISTREFTFNNVTITDTKYQTKGTLGGSIRHKNFGFWEMDLDLETDRLLVLDTELTPESLYYGTAFIDGTATLTGPVDELLIDVVATSSEDTVFKIPIQDGESLGDTSAIYFLSPEEKKARIEGEKVLTQDFDGLELRFDLNITPVAEVEITVDQTNGSYLRGRGFGNLLIEINTNGKFVMNGDFTATEGIYNFKYAGIVNKNFIIEPGGTMNWTGDPTNANIDVSAVYSTSANPSILLDNPNLNAQIPVEVVTSLDGDLSFFDPEFQIRFPNTNSVVSSELQYRLEDRSQRQLQALSLVTSGSFYNPNSIGQNAVTGNVVESFTGIINDLVDRDGGQVDFGVSYEATERNPNSDLQRSDRFGISLSTQITDRVFINGKLGVPIGATSATERAVIGNVEIEFLLNDDGTVRLKLFNRENTLQQFGQQEDYTQGLGLQYQVNFDSLAELYEKIFKKKIKVVPVNRNDLVN